MASNPQITSDRIDDVTSDWPEKPAKLAEQLVEKYGTPDELTSARMFWHDVGQWKRIQLYRDGTPHNFPKKHEDHLRQTIDYPIEPADAEPLLEFDGSNVLYRTRGELAADCHKESMNVLTLNLAHEILTGEKTVEEARRAFAETAVKTGMGEKPPTTQELQFDVPQGDQGDPDEVLITDELKRQVKQEMDDR